ncbi:MAG: class I SAM-dependent methyltransferase [Calothrix sp. MO_167.B42]|nr:class I SAM-dependent methyltransferase [Calothrix sp. MO_167.B42]
MNEYTAIVDYYDLLMTSGYYQYEKIAQAIASIISTEQKVIEIGVGTGLLLEKLLDIDPNYNLAGMDHTSEMIDIAKKRLGDRLNLFVEDIASMSISEEFDVAISNGGIGAFVDTGNNYDLYTHLTDDAINLQAMKNIANCLNKGGLFLINIQGVHDNYDKHLPDGIVYSQEIVESKTNKNCIEKSFYFRQNGKTVAQQTLTYRFFQGEAIQELFNQAGFQLKGKDASGNFFIYSKK